MLEQAISAVKQKSDHAFQEYHAGRLVQMAIDSIMAILLCRDATRSERKRDMAVMFLSKALPRVASMLAYVEEGDRSWMDLHKNIIDVQEAV
jgi:hypothetical protein